MIFFATKDIRHQWFYSSTIIFKFSDFIYIKKMLQHCKYFNNIIIHNSFTTYNKNIHLYIRKHVF